MPPDRHGLPNRPEGRGTIGLAAREAIDASGPPFVPSARVECYLVGHPKPFAESVRRLDRYREACAERRYAPGQRPAEEIGWRVREVNGPVNLVMGLVGAAFTVNEPAAIGVKRISVGGSLARASYAVVQRAAAEVAGPGSFAFAADAIPDREMNACMAGDKGGAR